MLYLQTMVQVIRKPWLQRRRQRTRRSIKKIWRRIFGSSTRSRSIPKWNSIRNSSKCNLTMHLSTIASNWNGSKKGTWLPHDLTERNIEWLKTMCKMLLQRHKRKTFLHWTVTGDEKWIAYDNPKRPKAWVCIAT